jgi:L-ascorbate metabolism protein UlaG (beta-lactamase superfamily)
VIGRPFLTVLVLFLAAAQAAAGEERGELRFTFIGNEAFEITDGKTKLLSDFPYRSGYSIYMEYDERELDRDGDIVCLVTHRHPDHFEPRLFQSKGWAFIGPAEVAEKINGEGIVSLGDDVKRAGYKDIEIEVLPTPHSDTEHYCYIVEWHGVRLFFSGDTEDPATLLAAERLDVAFVTPWLLDSVRRAGKRIDATRVVVYHHRAEELVPDFHDRLVPRQGDTFTVDY